MEKSPEKFPEENIDTGRRKFAISLGAFVISVLTGACAAKLKEAMNDSAKEDPAAAKKRKFREQLPRLLDEAEWQEKRADDYFKAAKREIVDYKGIGELSRQINRDVSDYKKNPALELQHVLDLAYLQFALMHEPLQRRQENLKAAFDLYSPLVVFYAVCADNAKETNDLSGAQKYEQKIRELTVKENEAVALLNEMTNALIDADCEQVPPHSEIDAIEPFDEMELPIPAPDEIIPKTRKQ